MRVQHLPRPRRHAPWRVAFVALHVAGLAAMAIGPPLVPHELRGFAAGLLAIILIVGAFGPVRDAAAALPALSPLIAFVAMVAESTCACPHHDPHGPWPFLAVIAALVVGDSVIALCAPETVPAPLPRARVLADAPDLG